MEIKVLGTGCANCKALYATVEQAVKDLNLDATLLKEEDILKIMEYNIFSLPALVINEKVVSAGKNYPYRSNGIIKTITPKVPMKHLFLIIVSLLLFSCAGKSKTENKQEVSVQGDRVEVICFHGKQRCVTCRAIEKLTNEVIEATFKDQIAKGKVVYKVIDISDPKMRRP